MKIEQLEQLIKIVEEGSMNEAARKLYIARSSLSTSMKNLEQELNGKIFHRSSQGISLTAFGTEVYLQAKDICTKVNFLHHIPEQETITELSVASMYCSLACEGFIRLCQRHPKFSGSVEEYPLLEVIQQVKSGLAEIGFITLFYDGEAITLKQLEELHLEFHKILDRRLYAIVGNQNPYYHQQISELDITELQDYPYIANFGAAFEYSWSGLLRGRRRQKADIHVSDMACALRLVEETNGFMIETFDSEIYRSFYAPGKYRFIPLKGESLTCRLGWIKRKDQELSPAAKELLSIIDEIKDK